MTRVEKLLLLLLPVPFGIGFLTPGVAQEPIASEVVFHFTDPAIVESSGLVARDGLVVTVNDSGDSNRVFSVDPATGAMSALHTHEGDGTIHIEADTVGEKFTLGQLFTQWGVALTPTQIGGAQAKPGEKMTVTSNGTPVTGDPADLQLEPDQQIELTLP